MILRVAIRESTSQGVNSVPDSIYAKFGRLGIRIAHSHSHSVIQLISGCGAALMRARPVAISDLEHLICLRGL